MISTTIAGSLPKPHWLAETERLWPQWRLDGPELERAKEDAVRIAIFEQERAGIDLVTDGEQFRRHFVHGFLERIDGVDFSKIVRKGIRADRYQADLPTVTGPVRRRGSAHGDEARFARSLTTRKLKVTMPGPMTIVDTLHDEYYGSRKALALAFAELLREEIGDLAAAGVDVVQLDEPAFNVYFEDLAEWGVEALDAAIRGAPCATAVHVCYGYGIPANLEWKRGLGQTWDQYAIVLPLLARSRIGQISIELAGSRVSPKVLALAGDKQLAVGVIDVADERVETPEEVCRTLRMALEHVPIERLAASTNCGMAPMSREVAYAKLRALGAGAKLVSA
ncbi:MAG TPA: methionine synthase [Candidatus Tumulicola sp.]|nr:methionine synthase [Candidatus Tumulicola sp.]